jgi:hypothetical protein
VLAYSWSGFSLPVVCGEKAQTAFGIDDFKRVPANDWVFAAFSVSNHPAT